MNGTPKQDGNMLAHAESLNKLGKHKTDGGCLYINKPADDDTKVLKQMINYTVKAI